MCSESPALLPEERQRPRGTATLLSQSAKVDITDVTLTGAAAAASGRWQNFDQELKLGKYKILVLYDESNDPGRNLALTLGSKETTPEIQATVIYQDRRADDHVTVNGFGRISLTDANKINVGDLSALYSGGAFSGYTLTLYVLQTNGSESIWKPMVYTIDAGDTANILLVPGTAPDQAIRLSVKNNASGVVFNIMWSLAAETSDEVTVSDESALIAAMKNDKVKTLHIAKNITLTAGGGPVFSYSSKQVRFRAA